MRCSCFCATVASFAVALLALAVAQRFQIVTSSSSSDPYKILGLPTNADTKTITKAYRKLAKRWHPDRNGGDKAAEQVFTTVAHAYEVLTNPEKREIFDRLGEGGLERMRDGDPSVHKDWLPPDEMLRRLHNDGDQTWLDAMVVTGFTTLSSVIIASQQVVEPFFFTFADLLGLDSRVPTVQITASESTSGVALLSGSHASEGVTFKFSLSGKSFDFDATDVTHTGCDQANFLGMKTTFYLQCHHVPGTELSVQVPADAFTVTGREGSNRLSATFVLSMT